MTGGAFALVHLGKLTLVLVLVAIDAAPERELAVPSVAGHSDLVTTGACHGVVFAGQWIWRLVMGGEPDRTGEVQPLDRSVARRASAPEGGRMNGTMARNAIDALRRR